VSAPKAQGVRPVRSGGLVRKGTLWQTTRRRSRSAHALIANQATKPRPPMRSLASRISTEWPQPPQLPWQHSDGHPSAHPRWVVPGIPVATAPAHRTLRKARLRHCSLHQEHGTVTAERDVGAPPKERGDFGSVHDVQLDPRVYRGAGRCSVAAVSSTSRLLRRARRRRRHPNPRPPDFLLGRFQGSVSETSRRRLE